MIQPLRGAESLILFIGGGEAPSRILAWATSLLTRSPGTSRLDRRPVRREASTIQELTPGSGASGT
jgi:cytochrome P450